MTPALHKQYKTAKAELNFYNKQINEALSRMSDTFEIRTKDVKNIIQLYRNGKLSQDEAIKLMTEKGKQSL